MKIDLFEQSAKEAGMKSAADHNKQWLLLARNTAKSIAERKGIVSIEDVREVIFLPSGNYLGSVFKGGEWEPAGFEIARHLGSHGRLVRRWKLR